MMCGIAGYIGQKNAPVVLFDMLKKLEYRGYDSAGIAYYANGVLNVPKDKGKVDEVREKLNPESLDSNIGLGHTRWATHGIPSKLNSHPHTDCTDKFVVAHNGIIENFEVLKQELIERGHQFKSDTDTEVISHLIEEYFEDDLLKCMPKVLSRLSGSYAIVAMTSEQPDRLVIARYESPLLIGVGQGENFIASDAPAFLSATRDVFIVEDKEYGEVRADGFNIYDLVTGEPVLRKPQTIDWDVNEAKKEGFHHYMLKEIHEEPQAARNAISDMEGISIVAKRLAKCARIVFLGCGTAYHAGLYGKYLLESFGIQSNAEIASEFRYSTVSTIDDEIGILAVSQSGETADTLAAMKRAKEKGTYISAVVNVVGSSITRCSDNVVYIHAGPEIGVASTKAYIGQLVSIAAICVAVAFERKAITLERRDQLMEEIIGLEESIQTMISSDSIRNIAESQANVQTFFFVGRRQNFPTALEGALKLKEISYVHAEGYAAGELKHGPLALMDDKVTVIAIIPQDPLRAKVESNISEISARGASVIRVGKDQEIDIPDTDPLLEPIVAIVPLHLFAYYISVLKGLDPDKPRNLAKSVTVE